MDGWMSGRLRHEFWDVWPNERRHRWVEVWEMNGWWMKGGREGEIGCMYELIYE